MRKKRLIAGFLARKLVLAFILAAVPPMLIAGKAATELANNAINSNIERWLRNTTRYIMASIKESESGLTAVHTLLRARFAGKDVSFSPEEREAFPDLDADVILLRDAAGGTLLSRPPGCGIAPAPLFPEANLKWVTLGDGSRKLAIAVGSDVAAWDGSRRRLELASLFAIQLSESGRDEPVSLRVFLPAGGGFVQAYSSAAGAMPAVPPEAFAAVLSGTDEVFVPDGDWTDNTPVAHLFIKAISGRYGETAAILAVSAHTLPYGGRLPSSRQLFWGFFVTGMLLATGAGSFLAGRIVRPVKLLNEGVKNIAAGDLGRRLSVHGDDEIAEVSAGFNLMGRQLEAMRREGVESARRDRSRMLGEIALGFAHEIRNPLVVIKTSAELVHAKLPEESKDSRLMGFVVEEVGRIDSLVREFLAFASPAPVAFVLFQLDSLVRDVLEISAAEFGRRAVRHSFVIDAADCGALGEPNQIRQVLLNLLLNAMEAMPEGGDLAVRLYESEDKQRICMEVADTGAGIAQDVLPTIYQPFASTKKGGLGLGLAKTRAIVEAHGGSLACSSVPGRGAVFTVCLNR
jgi:signal transduction histidine kinase